MATPISAYRRRTALLAIAVTVLGGCTSQARPAGDGATPPATTPTTRAAPDAPATSPGHQPRRRHERQRRLEIVAHRGGPTTGQTENSLPAVSNAGAADMVEFDIRPTSDGGLVVMHDSGLVRTTDCDGPVLTRTVADLTANCRLTDGSALPTFAEFVAAATRAGVPMMIELKSGPGWSPEVFRDIRTTLAASGPTDEHVFLSFDQDLLDRARREMPDIPGIWIVPRSASTSRAVLDRNVGGFLIDGELTTRAWVEQAHRQGQLVIGRVVDSETGWQACRAIGLDAVLSDRLPEFLSWRAGTP